jgi:DNA-binding LytR/AlgR family response regulator
MKIVIIEDEQMAANRLVKMLQDMNADCEIAAILESVQDSVAYLKTKETPDLILMDIQLADGISFEIFDMVDIDCPVVFTTAYDEYALKAFQVHAVDYLLKPIKKDELTNTLLRIKDTNQTQQETIQQLDYPGKSKKVLVKLGQHLKVLSLDEAAFYYSENKMSFYMDAHGKRFPLDLSLDRVEEMLDVKRFFRVNRQFIINDKYIQNMVTYSVNRIKVTMSPEAPDEVIVSKDKVSRFRKWLVA